MAWENLQVVQELDDLEEAICELIDGECNRTFDGLKTETRDVGYLKREANIAGFWDFFAYGYWWFDMGPGYSWENSAYALTTGVRNVTDVKVNGTWDGTEWVDGDVLDAEDYRLVFRDLDGWYHGILLPASGYTTVLVTGDWEDGWSADEVPASIRNAVNFILIDEFRLMEQSPAGEIGPQGLATFLRNPWNFDRVQKAIKHHKFYPIFA